MLTRKLAHSISAIAMALFVCASSSTAQNLPWEVYLDDQAGSICDIINAANAELVVWSATGEFVLVSGTDVFLADYFVDESLDVFFFNGFEFEDAGFITFVQDGDGFSTLWWVSLTGTVVGVDDFTSEPYTTDLFPSDFVDVPCDACDFWDDPLEGCEEVVAYDCTAATPLPLEAPPIVDTIDPATGEDWFSIAVEADHQYDIFVDARPGNWAPRIQLYDEDCETLLDEGDWFTVVPSSPGMLFLRIASWWGVGSYEVTVSDLGELPDDHGDTPPAATPIPTAGTVVSGAIGNEDDEDFFDFRLNEGGAYRIEIRNLMDCCPCAWMELLDAEWNSYDETWACVDSEGWQGFVYDVPAGAGGTYYLRVTGDYADTRLLYDVRVSQGVFDDPDPDPEPNVTFNICGALGLLPTGLMLLGLTGLKLTSRRGGRRARVC